MLYFLTDEESLQLTSGVRGDGQLILSVTLHQQYAQYHLLAKSDMKKDRESGEADKTRPAITEGRERRWGRNDVQ